MSSFRLWTFPVLPLHFTRERSHFFLFPLGFGIGFRPWADEASRPCRLESVRVVRCVCDGMGERVDEMG